MRTKEVALAFAISCLVMALAGCDDDTEPPPAEDHHCIYMPTDVGNRWEYKVTVDSMFNPREEYKLTYEMKSTKNPYEGFPAGYIVTITKEGGSPEEIIAAPFEKKCYLERVRWAFLAEDDMKVGEWSQTGLIVDFPLEYRRDVEVTVPSGKFKCRELFFDNGNEFRPEKWSELYAENVGLVYYENDFKQYQVEPFELIDSRLVKYEIIEYNVRKR
jgi:phage pi2 protein 07